MTPKQRDKKLGLLKNQAKMLMASFDSVQIFATKLESEEDSVTSHYSFGFGNWFTRYGHVKSWLIIEENHLDDAEDK